MHLRPGADDQLSIQSALLGAAPGSVVCLEAGRYALSDGLSLGVPGLTLRGASGVVFDFSSQGAPAPGLDITGDDVTVEGIAFHETVGTAVRVLGADNVRLRNLGIAWTSPGEDAHGISLLESSNTWVKDVEVVGASGAGVRTAGSFRVLIDGASLLHNRAGVRLEGGADVEVVGTDLQSNGDGVVAAGVERLKIHNNLIEGAPAPAATHGGLGLSLVGASQVEVHANTIRGNVGGGVRDDGSQRLAIHGNRFEGNGPGGAAQLSFAAQPTLLCLDGEAEQQATIEEGAPLLREEACPLPPLPSLHL